ncbi:squalene--hopene cyclase [Nocardia terpenica]|uniref:squalene--hopene cyclase n=1 Tax=Nocardia terpenica TaxID=455432 RepID=UPI001894C4A7|nr:squalene--hopene cyclase [Nocardia terpenica]MBF6059970.1 squalene--hopene cyclase [Nocardia terpenica]MBF6102489.1 squalene--hopene cyclase [Nocardia terpenica]MBF6111320.1 squalene--hopene cyclase [Nocardia terpenica]MBF6117451.1 squalene--hopene cyclase [Nocardia terpenica]MBF6150708.1 squalene--hopene cyclase [Nocardia terpenica]
MTATDPDLTTPSTAAAATDALGAAVGHLRALQHETGWWKGELATNVTMDAEDLLLREFLGISTPAVTEPAARWIRSQQRPDGTWATFHDGPGDLSTTVEAWVALRLAGDAADAPHLRAAAEFVRASGGVENSRVFTRIWLALFGLWSWDELPNLPPELVFLPSWFPLNIYDWGCWARQTVVPLTVVSTLRPSRPLPFGINELRSGAPRPKRQSILGLAGLFQRLDSVLHGYARYPVAPVRTLAMRRAAEWILARQEADGGWGGIQPPWVYSLLALHLLGYPLDHPAIRAGIEGLDGFTVREHTPDGEVRRLEACQSPVWDTGLAVAALLDAGVPGDDPAVLRATDWLLGEQITGGGDWQVRRPRLESGGWAFEFANDVYPDTDDTAEIVLALHRVSHPDPARLAAAVDRAAEWTVGMQSRDGGWGAFDADNTSTLPMKLPFCDFGAVTDPPSADVTAHVVEMMAALGRGAEPACRRGVRWLLDHQESDGSWFGRWGANYVYGTGAAVPALVATGMNPRSTPIRTALAWLAEHQNPDGGWGEDLRSYRDPAWIGRGTSTASQTAWALLALLAADPDSPAVDRGVAWLIDTQRPDGTWDEDHYTGTGFPGDFYINYHLYRLVFPIWALGRYTRARQRPTP